MGVLCALNVNVLLKPFYYFIYDTSNEYLL